MTTLADGARRKITPTAAFLLMVVAVHIVAAFTSALPAIHNGGDNAAYISLANSLARDGAYTEVWHPGAPPHAKYPPLYPAVLALMILAGAKTWGAFKAASLVFTTLSTAFCFLWVRKLHGPRAAMAAALVFGVSPAVLLHAQWVLADPLFLALTLGCLWFLTPPRQDTPAAGTGALGLDTVAGLALAIAAYFTRSAGLPLLVAVVLWLGLKRRWRPLGILAGLFAVPATLWQLRSGGDYVSEFWLINPYAPDLGRASPVELLERVAGNLWMYVSDYVPSGVTGLDGSWAAVFGVVLAGLGGVGWLRRTRAGAGVAELFFVLYVGLILAWPAQWSGDRFALPLFPLVLLYAGETLAAIARAIAHWRPTMVSERPEWLARLPVRALGVTVATATLVPSGLSWLERSEQAPRCRERVIVTGPFGCYAAGQREFHAMALWAGDNLPEGTVVFSRKPRLFYAFSGHPSVTYPFTFDDRRLLAQADSLGIGYIVRSNWDNSGPAYVDPVIAANLDRFCVVSQLQLGSGPPTSLLAILEPAADDSMDPATTPESVRSCPLPGGGTVPILAALGSPTVPILDR